MDTRIFVHKKEQFQVESESLAAELRQSLSLNKSQILTICDKFLTTSEIIRVK